METQPETETARRLSNLNLSEVLRKIGVISIISAAFTFLIQGVNDWYSTERLFAFSGCVVVLIATSYFCTIILGDKKSGGILSSLGGFLSPALSAAIGGLILAIGNNHPILTQAQKLFFFQGTQAIYAWPAIILGFVVLVFSLLNSVAIHQKEKILESTLFLIIFNLALIFTTRDALTWNILNLLLTYILISNTNLIARFHTTNNIESRLLSYIPFISLFTIHGRTLLLYDGNIISIASILLVTSSLIFFSHILKPSLTKEKAICFFAQISFLISGYEIFKRVFAGLEINSAISFNFQIAAILSVVLIKILAGKFKLQHSKELNLCLLFIGALIGSNADLFFSNILSIIVGIVLLAIGMAERDRPNFFLGVVILTIGAFNYLRDLINFAAGYYWVAFFIIGVCALVLSSGLHYQKKIIVERFKFLLER